MKNAIVIALVVVLGGLIVVGTMNKPKVTPEEKQARREALAAKEAEKKKTTEFCAANAKPFSTTVSYDQDPGQQSMNGFKACMKEHGVEGYEDAPMPVTK